MAVLGILGLAVSSYLAYAHYREVSTICLQGMECDEVLSSSYASLYGVPLSVLGLIVYALVVLLGLLIWRGSAARQNWFGLAAYVVALSATLWSLYLYYLEIFEIGAFCTWCVVSSLVVFTLMVLALVNIRRLRTRPQPA
jgi:uncharacterized membrane protein